MRELIDDNTQLIIKNFTEEELITNDEIKDKINSWSDDEKIKKYITSHCLWGNKLFEHLYGLNNLHNRQDPNYSQLYFIYNEEDELLAVALLSNNKSQYKKIIQYIAVNPQIQGQGIGSRLLSTIINNPQFFQKGKKQFLLGTAVEKSNIASRKIIKKNGFIPYKKINNNSLHLYIRHWKSSKEMTN